MTTATKTLTAESRLATTAQPRCRWGRFSAGLALGTGGCGLGLWTALTAGAAWGGHAQFDLPMESLIVRGLISAALIATGFALMVAGVSEAPAETDLDLAAPAPVEAGAARDELICRRCNAANDTLARYCDQCGLRL